MRGLAEHLGLLVLQQRGAATTLESDLLHLVREVTALKSLTLDYGSTLSSPPNAPQLEGEETRGDEQQQQSLCYNRALPPQGALRLALETERQGLLRGVEAVREVQLLLKAVVGSDPPTPSMASASPEARLERARGGEGWGEAPTDPVTAAEVKSAVDGLEISLSEMLGCVERYPAPRRSAVARIGSADESGRSVDDGAFVAAPLLATGAVRVVVKTREALRACAVESRKISDRFAGVLPRAVLVRVAKDLFDVHSAVGSVLDGSDLMRSWLLADCWAGGDGNPNNIEAGEESVVGASASSLDVGRQAAAEHASTVGGRLTDAVKAMLLSVQALCPRDGVEAAAAAHTLDKGAVTGGDAAVGAAKTNPGAGEESDEEGDAWSTGTTLFEAHCSAFEQARGLKLWRCASAMASARLALKDLSEDKAVCSDGVQAGCGAAGEAASALVPLCADVLVLAEQVLSAGKAVLVGLLALNKVS